LRGTLRSNATIRRDIVAALPGRSVQVLRLEANTTAGFLRHIAVHLSRAVYFTYAASAELE
jgi:hypothetical protein